MSESKSSIWERWFARKKKEPGDGLPGDAFPGSERSLNVDQPTVGLCFNYERDLGYRSAILADEGLDRVLRVLRARKLRATFNVAARLCDVAPEQVRMIARAGHELGAFGYERELPSRLIDDELRLLVERCRDAFSGCGLHPVGFCSPRSKWDMRLCRELVKQGFYYSAEHDKAKQPYYLIEGPPPLVRIPIRTDDMGFIRKKDEANVIVSKLHRCLRKAIADSHFTAIVFHPWVLAEDGKRMEEWETWLDAARNSGARVGAMEDVLPEAWRSRRPLMAEGEQ